MLDVLIFCGGQRGPSCRASKLRSVTHWTPNRGNARGRSILDCRACGAAAALELEALKEDRVRLLQDPA